MGRTLLYAAFLSLTGCLSEPTFLPVDGAAPNDASSSSSTTADDMVLIPSTALPRKGKTCKDGEAKDDCVPALTVPAFFIDGREVGTQDFLACVAAGACTAAGTGPGCTDASLGDHPANCVTKAQATAFCGSKQKRLVRTAEWDAAAGGTAGRMYPWGDEPPSPDRLNACGLECAQLGMYPRADPFVATAPRGSFAAGRTPEGVADLAGNVAEWVEADTGMVRGGSYADVDPRLVKANAALPTPAESSDPHIGFRCARDGS